MIGTAGETVMALLWLVGVVAVALALGYVLVAAWVQVFYKPGGRR